MIDVLRNSTFFPIALTVVAFCIGAACQKRWKKAILNPILIGAGLVMLALYMLDIPVETYQQGCKALSFFLERRCGWTAHEKLDVTSSDRSMSPQKIDLSGLSRDELKVVAKEAFKRREQGTA